MGGGAFYHTTVLLKEAVDGLDVKADGVYVDATFGGGGHSREILSRLGPEGRLIAFDHDADAWRNKPDDERLIAVTENFRYLQRFLRVHGYPVVDGILADLGVSSFQFDTAERGFSIRFDGPLDMRMDRRLERTAADVLRTYSESQLHLLFEQYGEVRNARQLARHIVGHRGTASLQTIGALKALLGPVIKGNPNRYLAQVFQALRIEVNEEMEVLKDFLRQAAQCLKPGGRLCVITFHSLEDRIVKQFMKRGKWEEATQAFDTREEAPPLKPVLAKPQTPTSEEINNNPRARSARLRIAESV
jgi:16S rRNA (cytosine1402-N4)-methyltransferase